jgi:hypothetical protein
MNLPSRITTDELDNMFQTATYVERHLPGVNMKNLKTEMFLLIEKLYGISKTKDCYPDDKKPIKIRLNADQIAIYEFCLLLLLKANEKDRDIIQIRNFPQKRSFRQMKRFFLPDSHEKIRQNYYQAMSRLVSLYHLKGKAYFLK